MTIKTVVIAIAMVVGFATFLSVTWDISGRMLQKSAPATKQQPVYTQPIQKAEDGQSDQDKEASSQEPASTKTGEDESVKTGAYEDSWTGSAVAPIEKSGSEKSLTIQPSTIQPVTTKSDSAATSFPSDDRETDKSEDAAGSSLPARENSNPYQADEREYN